MTFTPMAESCIDSIGGTSLVKLNSVTKGLEATVAVKLEYLNPTCSVKDRAARSMIEAAEEAGEIQPGKSVIVEGTSGNMGISIAAICNQKGYKCIMVMPSVLSLERRVVMKSLGATVILTNPEDGLEGVMDAIDRIADVVPNSFKTNQFANPSNPLGHYKTTGPEIWEQTNGKVDIVVFGIGTAGTVTGTGRYLKEQNPNVGVYGMEPHESSVLNGFPRGPHKIQGIGSGSIPPLLDRSIIDEILRVKSDDSVEMSRRLVLEEGIMACFSSGANVCAAIQLAQRPENKGKLIVTTVNSQGERYLSTELYGEIRDEVAQLNMMTPEEQIAIVKKEYNC